MSGWGSEDIGGKPPKPPRWLVLFIVATLAVVFAVALYARHA